MAAESFAMRGSRAVAEVRAACRDDLKMDVTITDAEIQRVIAVKKLPSSSIATAQKFQQLKQRFEPASKDMACLSKALGSGWIWPGMVRGHLLCVKVARLTSDHSPEDMALAIYYALEWLVSVHKHAASAGVTVLINMEDAGVQTVEKLVRQHTVGKLSDIFANGTYPMRIRAVYVYHCSSICGLAVRAARSYLPTKLRERVTLLKTTEVQSLVPEFDEATGSGAFEAWWHGTVLPAVMKGASGSPAATTEVPFLRSLPPNEVGQPSLKKKEALSREIGALPLNESSSTLEAVPSGQSTPTVAALEQGDIHSGVSSLVSSAATTPTKDSCDTSLLSDLSSDDDDEVELKAFKAFLKEEMRRQHGVMNPATPEDFEARLASRREKKAALKAKYALRLGSVSELSLKPRHQRRLKEQRHALDQEMRQLSLETEAATAIRARTRRSTDSTNGLEQQPTAHTASQGMVVEVEDF